MEGNWIRKQSQGSNPISQTFQSNNTSLPFQTLAPHCLRNKHQISFHTCKPLWIWPLVVSAFPTVLQPHIQQVGSCPCVFASAVPSAEYTCFSFHLLDPDFTFTSQLLQRSCLTFSQAALSDSSQHMVATAHGSISLPFPGQLREDTDHVCCTHHLFSAPAQCLAHSWCSRNICGLNE